MKKKKFLTVVAALLLSLSVVGAASANTVNPNPELQDGSKYKTKCARIPIPCMAT